MNYFYQTMHSILRQRTSSFNLISITNVTAFRASAFLSTARDTISRTKLSMTVQCEKR